MWPILFRWGHVHATSDYLMCLRLAFNPWKALGTQSNYSNMSVGAPSRQAVSSLYHNMLRTLQSFSSYNFREYFVRRTKETFRTMQVSSFLLSLCINLLKFLFLPPPIYWMLNESERIGSRETAFYVLWTSERECSAQKERCCQPIIRRMEIGCWGKKSGRTARFN